MIVHVHIPKTAGSALNRFVLMPNFPGERIFHAYGARKDARDLKAARAAGPIDLVAGHIHSRYAGLNADPDAVFISLLREPTARFLSSINFILLKKKNPILQRRPELAGDGDALITALTSNLASRLRHSDVTTKFVAGQARRWPLAPGAFAAATRRLQSPNYVWGFQDRFDAFAERLDAELGLKRHAAPSTEFVKGDPIAASDPDRRANIAPKVFRAEDLTPKTRALVENLNRVDLKLYDWALRRESRLSDV